MSPIRYICVSDLHFGQDMSVLTPVDADGNVCLQQQSPSLQALMRVLAALRRDLGGERVGLVLLGDVLEIAVAPMNVASACFSGFVDLLSEAGQPLFDEVYYVPGNHDHHLFEIAREDAYAAYLERAPRDAVWHRPWHATNLFVHRARRTARCQVVHTLLAKNPDLSQVQEGFAYPNLGFESAARTVLVHHGHFFERLYRLMSELADVLYPDREPPADVWDWEAENFAWIDFFWSSMGRQGGVGPLVDDLYKSLLRDKALVRRLEIAVAALVRRMAPRGLHWLYTAVLNAAVRAAVRAVARRERGRADVALSTHLEAGIRAYLSGPVLRQLRSEQGRIAPLSVVFGHTHKPFQQRISVPDVGEVALYNTGGWVVESVEASPVHGGAIAVLDDDLHAALVHCWGGNQDSPRVLDPLWSDAAALVARLDAHVRSDPSWSRLAEAVRADVAVRQRVLRHRTNGAS